MSKSKTTSPAKRGRERLTFKRWAVLTDADTLASRIYTSEENAEFDAKDCRELEGQYPEARAVRVTVTVDPSSESIQQGKP